MDTFDYVNDPITAGQIATLQELLAEAWTDKARDGFLVIAGRFVDEMGTDRTGELEALFSTQRQSGREVLRDSLETLMAFVGTFEDFDSRYTVYINDPVHGSLGLFPQLPITGIPKLYPVLYRLFDTNSNVHGDPNREKVSDYIIRTGKLPLMKPPSGLILRHKPRMYWCSHERYGSPQESRAALQILDRWNSDCRFRATMPTAHLDGNVFVAYSGVTEYPPYLINLSKGPDVFAGYNVEVTASDHPELPGGGLQVGVVGEPAVSRLERWTDDELRWVTVWHDSRLPQDLDE